MTNSKPTAGSGSGLREKGDNHLPLFVVEDKATNGLSYQIRQHVLAALEQAARKEEKWPALSLHFVRPNGIVSQDWVMFPASVANILLRAARMEISRDMHPLFPSIGSKEKIMAVGSGKATIEYGRNAPDPGKL